MGKETIKSFILTVLIFLSLIMTWGLWTYQPQYDFVQNTRSVQSVTIGQNREVAALIHPTELIYHKNGKHYGAMNQQNIVDIMNDLNKWSFSSVDVVSRNVSRKTMDRFFNVDHSLELIYPQAIPEKVLTSIFTIPSSKLKLTNIDRIFVPLARQQNGEETFIYFFSNEEQKLVKVRVNHAAVTAFTTKFSKTLAELPSYFALETGNDMVYLPEVGPTVEQVTYSSQSLAIIDFKNALFSEPGLVKQYNGNNGEESYTDGAKALEVFYPQNNMRYVNPSPEVYNMADEDVVLNSIDFVNEHAGWTDNYLFFEWDAARQSTIFRLFIEGYPVFNSGSGQPLTTIKQTWRNHEIYEYTRSLVNLRFSISNQRGKVQLPSGKELLTFLKKEKRDFSPSKLTRVQVSYEMMDSQSIVISFMPFWYVQYDGEWEKLIIPNQGGKANGLE